MKRSPVTMPGGVLAWEWPPIEWADARGIMHIWDYPIDWAVRRFWDVCCAYYGARGTHANANCQELIWVPAGLARLRLEAPGGHAAEFTLAPGLPAIEIPPWRWVDLVPKEADTRLIVLASESFDDTVRITDRATFEAGPR